jgi:hypothetical protein
MKTWANSLLLILYKLLNKGENVESVVDHRAWLPALRLSFILFISSYLCLDEQISILIYAYCLKGAQE